MLTEGFASIPAGLLDESQRSEPLAAQVAELNFTQWVEISNQTGSSIDLLEVTLLAGSTSIPVPVNKRLKRYDFIDISLAGDQLRVGELMIRFKAGGDIRSERLTFIAPWVVWASVQITGDAEAPFGLLEFAG